MNQTIDINTILTSILTPVVKALVEQHLPKPSADSEDLRDLETTLFLRLNGTLDHKIHNALHDSIQERVQTAVDTYFEEAFMDRARQVLSDMAGGRITEYLEEWVNDKVSQRLDDDIDERIGTMVDRKIANCDLEDTVLEVIEKTTFTLARE